VAGYAVAAFALISLSAPGNLIVASLIFVATELIIDDIYPWIPQVFSGTPSTRSRGPTHTTHYHIHRQARANDPFDGYVPPPTSHRVPRHAPNDRRDPVGTESPEPQWDDVSPLTRRRTTGTVFSSTPRRADDDDRRDPVGSGDSRQRYWTSNTSVGTPSLVQPTPPATVDHRDPVGQEETETPRSWNIWSAVSSPASAPTTGAPFRGRDSVGEE